MRRNPILSYSILATTTAVALWLGYGLTVAVVKWPLNPDTDQLVALYIGIGACLALYLLWLRRSSVVRFWMAYDHELLHLIGATIQFKRVQSFSVSDAGRGGVQIENPNFLVAQAPYSVTVPMAIIAAFLLLGGFTPALWLSSVLSMCFVYHVVSVSDAYWHDTVDLRGPRKIFHSIWAAVALVLWIGIVVSGASQGSEGAVLYLTNSWNESVAVIR